jgi:hypothetical protein
MKVRPLITQTLTAVLPNTWLVELPPVPVFPAAVFDVDTTPEEGWCAGGGYDQHSVHLVVMARDADQLDDLLPRYQAALESLLPYFMYVEDGGDADYEADSSVFARYITVRLRMPRAT